MPFEYPILCTAPGCKQPACFKIAARWSDGLTEELKTYALTCEACLRDAYRRSLQKQAACHLTHGETLAPPAIFRLEKGRRDDALARVPELETHAADLPSP